jgi:hypothetical protein
MKREEKAPGDRNVSRRDSSAFGNGASRGGLRSMAIQLLFLDARLWTRGPSRVFAGTGCWVSTRGPLGDGLPAQRLFRSSTNTGLAQAGRTAVSTLANPGRAERYLARLPEQACAGKVVRQRCLTYEKCPSGQINTRA